MATLPHVVFFRDAEEDRDASIKAGHYVAKDVDMVKVTARGTKDNVIKKTADWFEGLSGLLAGNRISQAVFENYKEAYASFQKGEEIPEKGLAIRLWTGANPAQVKSLVAMNVFTVEQLAASNEQVIAGLGLHGRLLHQRAQAYLKQASDVGVPVMRMEKLEKENSELKDTVTSLLGQIEELKKLVPAAPAKG